jgi:ubiquinone/menaquinone biosynthesis C-methylase UbiE
MEGLPGISIQSESWREIATNPSETSMDTGESKMSTSTTGDQLNRVYGSDSPDSLVDGYDEWAKTYDQDMGSGGYRHPTICLALLARHAPHGVGPVLDAGAGTGLLGEWLRIVGYKKPVALDPSQGMLDIAQEKKAYDEYHKAFMGQTLPFEDDYFAAAVSAGVFTLGHVGPEGLDDLLRVVRPGGHIVLTVKDKLYSDGFQAHVKALCDAGRCTVVEETPSYISVPGEASHSTSRALVLQVL